MSRRRRTKAPGLSVGPGGLIPSSLGVRPGPSEIAVLVLHSVSNETVNIWVKFLTWTNQRDVFGIQAGNTSPQLLCYPNTIPSDPKLFDWYALPLFLIRFLLYVCRFESGVGRWAVRVQDKSPYF